MIKVIIVEDERIIRKGIENCIKWNDLGIGEVKTAENAEDAMILMEQEQFHIIISDICMPGMNGIELCRYYHEKSPESQIIFISGYSDKEYLMAAISLGAVSYVEKPVSAFTLTQAVKKAMTALNQITRAKFSLMHYLLNTTDIRKETFEMLGDFPQKKDSRFCVFILKNKEAVADNNSFMKMCECEIGKRIKEEIHFIVEPVYTNTFVGMISWQSGKNILENTVKRAVADVLLYVEEHDSFIGFGSIVSNLKEFGTSYRQAEEAMKLLACKGWKNYAFFEEEYREHTDCLMKEEADKLLEYLLKKEEKKAKAYVRKMTSYFVQQHYVLNFYLRNIYFELDRLILQAYRMLHLEGIEPKIQVHAEILAQAETLEEMSQYLQSHITEVLSESEIEQTNNYVIRNVMMYINEHALDKDLTVKQVADSVYLTQTYLSNLFKKKTGVTIGKYILDLRIRAAKQYLQDPQYKLYQISEMVGYTDANYFAKIFRKKTGKLPSEFREEAIHHE